MPQVDDKRKAARHRAAGVMRLLRLIRILPLGAALAAWLIALAAVSLLPGCALPAAASKDAVFPDGTSARRFTALD